MTAANSKCAKAIVWCACAHSLLFVSFDLVSGEITCTTPHSHGEISFMCHADRLRDRLCVCVNYFTSMASIRIVIRMLVCDLFAILLLSTHFSRRQND